MGVSCSRGVTLDLVPREEDVIRATKLFNVLLSELKSTFIEGLKVSSFLLRSKSSENVHLIFH